MSETKAKSQPGGFRMVEVKRVRDAVGAYCLDCQHGIGDPWSQKLHEHGTGHKTIMYKLV